RPAARGLNPALTADAVARGTGRVDGNVELLLRAAERRPLRRCALRRVLRCPNRTLVGPGVEAMPRVAAHVLEHDIRQPRSAPGVAHLDELLEDLAIRH